jgi:SWI/SNF-related matrix-associated actin-dependent regulator 1 of chromatin subfamily A
LAALSVVQDATLEVIPSARKDQGPEAVMLRRFLALFKLSTVIELAMRRLQAKSRAQSGATDGDVEIPAPAGETYLRYQKVGVAFAARRSNTLIADEMGLGKTVMAIGLANMGLGARMLVVCPASLRLNWRCELERWLIARRRITLIETGKDAWPLRPDVVVINYDLLGEYRTELRSLIWDLLVIDECHFIKSADAKRTVEVVGRLDEETGERLVPIPAKRRVLMTGTPILNRPLELWPIVHFLDPETWSDRSSFSRRYCAGFRDGVPRDTGSRHKDFAGVSHLDELQDRLRSTIMIRRLKADVLKELPPKRRQIIVIPPNGCAKYLEAERQAQVCHEVALREARAAVELAKALDDEVACKNAVDRLRDASRAAFEEIARVRHGTAVAKVPYVVEHLRAVSGKCVVFCHHYDVVDDIKAELGDAAVVADGRVPTAERQAAVDRFQTDPACQYFIGSIRAVGVGITLTAASHVVFAELDWTPGAMSQAEDRLHRVRQRNSVLVQHVVLDGSIDARLARTIVARQEAIAEALDAEDERPSSALDRRMRHLGGVLDEIGSQAS